MSARAIAAAVLLEVANEGQSLSACLNPACENVQDARERGFIKALCYGVLRYWPRLNAIADHMLEKGLPPKAIDIRILLLLGLYQLIYTRVAQHAAVAETVAAAKRGRNKWAAGMLNGILRRFTRESVSVLESIDRDDTARLAHPRWILDALREAWPEDWRAIVTANNDQAPMSVRVNARQASRAEYCESLSQTAMQTTPVQHTSHGLSLVNPVDVEALPGFRTGAVSVQDGASQLAAPLLALAPHQRVLDACAAPGGKTAHILESEAELAAVVALDSSASRLARAERGLQRLGLNATLCCADAAKPEQWWDKTPFDRILLDAPCSATGVIRRHPDIKLHRRASDLPILEKQQQQLLQALWPLLARNGRLLYATCSVLPRENDRNIERFLDRTQDAESLSIDATWGRATLRGRQILPGESGMDGFYYAVLVKR